MGYIAFILCIALFFALALVFIRRGRFVLAAKLVRFFIVVVALTVFAFWFIRSSMTQFQEDAMVIQVINKLPQPIDFYIIKKNSADENLQFTLNHTGKIRPEHYRIDYLNMKNSSEYWIAGYLGKKNLVYFSRHLVPNKNMDQIVEVKNYINQNLQLSRMAVDEISNYRAEITRTSIWICLDLLLLFLNIVLLIRKR
ncbi:hypothetical protein [Chryseobacterium sp.]|uniref:hypothetical protein n=1 Tax=Chryseobacterium sp. TaxID=1871047 RepID=UPI0011CBBC23|nr:hypothetical protein [Chryseobacterium sp.]TXF77496.1 hypothetical protein FUA25_06095 [Chryseobacterium sp.]